MIMRGVAAQDCTHVRKTGGLNARVTTSIGGGGGTWASKGVGQRADHRHFVRGAAVRDARNTWLLRHSQRATAAS